MPKTVTLELDPAEEVLARHPPPLSLVDPELLDRIAALALRISQVDAEKRGLFVPESYARRYQEFTAPERARQRATVLRVLQAATLVGLLEIGD